MFFISLAIISCLTGAGISPATDTCPPANAKNAVHYKRSNPIDLDGAHDIVISNKSFSNSAVPAISLKNCNNISIVNNSIVNGKAVGIFLYKCKNIKIVGNYIARVSSGVYSQQCTNGIVVERNEFYNMQGPFPRGQFVQFNGVNGSGNSISHNHGENILAASHPEDAINLFKSSGTATSPIKITGNWLRGGGPSASGGGIMLGDQGGAYQTAEENILVNPGQYGMAIAGGSNNSILNNVIFGRRQSFTNVGIYVQSVDGHTVINAVVKGNKVRYINKDNNPNNNWLAPGTNKPAGWDDANTWGADIDAAVLPDIIITAHRAGKRK